MKRLNILILILLTTFLATGCSLTSAENQSDKEGTAMQSLKESTPEFYEESIKIAESCQEIYEQAQKEQTLNSLKTIKDIVNCIGELGYAVVDEENQIDMVNPEKAEGFIGSVENKKEDTLTIICVVADGGFIRFDFQTAGGTVNITRSYLSWEGREINIKSKYTFEASVWKYSEEGYLFFEEYHMPGYDGASGHTAIRVASLNETCRELNRKYILPVGYRLNNLFLSDWSEAEFGEIDFYDMFDIFYPHVSGKPVPYEMDSDLGKGAVYQIPEEEFEKVIGLHFNIDNQTLQQKTRYLAETKKYEYRPRGLYDCEQPNHPYPEVVGYAVNEDGTINLTVNAVFPNENSSQIYMHEVTVRPLADDGFQYISNQRISFDEKKLGKWHKQRLTDKEWEKLYGEGGE